MLPAIRKLWFKHFSGKRPVYPYISPSGIDNEESASLLKGHQFESFVVSRFTPSYFILHHWRSDKRCGDIFPLSNNYPDLEYEYHGKTQTRKFAVECKWMPGFAQGSVLWATDRQIRHFLEYHYASNTPVFIILGIGGQPSEPEEVYIIPLDDIDKNQTQLSAEFLQRYKKDYAGEAFFLHPEKMAII